MGQKIKSSTTKKRGEIKCKRGNYLREHRGPGSHTSTNNKQSQ